METLLKVLEAGKWKINGGDPFLWECFGENARFLDLGDFTTVVFDNETKKVFYINHFYDDDDSPSVQYVWVEPSVKEVYEKECKEREIDDETLISLDEILNMISENE